MQNNKLFVGGLAWATTDQGLGDAFAQAGQVLSARVVTDRMTGRSRGFGFVEMGTDEEAQKAIQMWNEQDLDGRVLIVNVAKPMEERPRDGGYQSRGGSGSSGGYGGGNSRGGFSGGRDAGRSSGGYGGGGNSRGGYSSNRGGSTGGSRGGGSGFRRGDR